MQAPQNSKLPLLAVADLRSLQPDPSSAWSTLPFSPAELTQSILEKYQAGVTGLNTLASSLSSSAKGLSESLVAGYTAYESQYCTEASFDVGEAMRRAEGQGGSRLSDLAFLNCLHLGGITLQ